MKINYRLIRENYLINYSAYSTLSYYIYMCKHHCSCINPSIIVAPVKENIRPINYI